VRQQIFRRTFTVSISPVSDIVLDVAMAVDPAKSQAAAERLGGGRTASDAPSGRFESTLQNTAARMPDARKNFGVPALSTSPRPHVATASARAYKGLEQLVLKNLVENMLPKNSSALFGSSTAGDIWRSMLADQLASEIGGSVDLGSARRQATGIQSAALSREANVRPASSSARGRVNNET
jgi:peptidoglycan hydrolase FlgJ